MNKLINFTKIKRAIFHWLN